MHRHADGSFIDSETLGIADLSVMNQGIARGPGARFCTAENSPLIPSSKPETLIASLDKFTFTASPRGVCAETVPCRVLRLRNPSICADGRRSTTARDVQVVCRGRADQCRR